MSESPAESPAATKRPVSVAIYGSCVSRDTVEFAGKEAFTVRRYIARQSLLSSGSNASSKFPEDHGITSSFQERMLLDDFAGVLTARLKNLADVDLLLWDLTDERHGVHIFDDGTVVTRSIDMLNTPAVLATVAETRHVPFGTDEHFELWSKRAEKFVRILTKLGLKSKTVALDIAWAEVTADGDPTPASMGTPPNEANEAYRRYWEVLRSLGVSILRLTANEVSADPGHQWGLAPFHYSQTVYSEILRRLDTDHELLRTST